MTWVFRPDPVVLFSKSPESNEWRDLGKHLILLIFFSDEDYRLFGSAADCKLTLSASVSEAQRPSELFLFLRQLDSVSRASEQTPLPTVQPDIMNARNAPVGSSLMAAEPEILHGHIPAGHIPKPVVIADYVVWVLSFPETWRSANPIYSNWKTFRFPLQLWDFQCPFSNFVRKSCLWINGPVFYWTVQKGCLASLWLRSVLFLSSRRLSASCLHRKYPSIQSAEDRDRYKAVFTDQYAEYGDLHKEVQAMAQKFEEMDRMMQDLASRPSSQMVKTAPYWACSDTPLCTQADWCRFHCRSRSASTKSWWTTEWRKPWVPLWCSGNISYSNSLSFFISLWFTLKSH